MGESFVKAVNSKQGFVKLTTEDIPAAGDNQYMSPEDKLNLGKLESQTRDLRTHTFGDNLHVTKEILAQVQTSATHRLNEVKHLDKGLKKKLKDHLEKLHDGRQGLRGLQGFQGQPGPMGPGGGGSLKHTSLTDMPSGTNIDHDGRYFTEAELNSNANALGASLIGIEDSLFLFTSTNVEAALAEVMDMITIVTHVADSVTMDVGSATGSVSDTQVLNENEYVIHETTGPPNPNFVSTFDFSGIIAGHEPNLIELHWGYNGGSGHIIELQMYNYDTTTWDVIDNTILSDNDGNFHFDSFNITVGGGTIVDYTSGGAARVRFSHAANGNAAHDFVIDYLAIKDDHGIGSGITDHGSLSGLSDDDHFQYHNDARAATWLAANQGTIVHDNLADVHQGVTTGDTPTFTQVNLSTEPEAVSNAVTKSYADALVTGAFWEDVMVATIANIDLATELEAGDIIDDYTLVEGDRVLVKEQTDQTENGLYVATASGAASRATDADTAEEIEGKKCIILDGALTKHRFYFCITGNITLGVTDIRFAEVTLMSDHNSLSGLQGGQVGPPTEYYHLTSSEHVELTAWLDDVILSNGGAMNISGALTATNYIAANLLTACASNAGELNFSAASKTLTVEDNSTVSQDYSSDASPTFAGLTLSGIVAEATDVDKFLVDSSGVIKYRTGAQVLSDIGAAASGHDHDGTYQPLDAELTSLADLTYAAASFIKMTGASTFALRTIGETKQDLSLDNVENVALSTWAGTSSITTLGIIVAGTWQGTTVAVNQGGTGQTTAQAAIDSLSAVSGATNEYVLTKDTVSGNAIWKEAAGGGGGALDDLSDVTIASVANDEILGYSSGWINRTLAEAGIQSLDSGLTSLAGLTYSAASFVKMTGADTFALRTIGETANDLEGTIDHANLANLTIAAHDTTATGANLTSLTDDSMVDTLHRHSELSASGGTPNRSLVIDAAGLVGIGEPSPGRLLSLKDATASKIRCKWTDTAGAGGIEMFENAASMGGFELFGSTHGVYPSTMLISSTLTDVGKVYIRTRTSGNYQIRIIFGNIGGMKLKEQATADGDTAGYGQLWVKNTNPTELWFTTDTGVDIKIV